MRIHVQAEIATCGNGMGGIPAGLDIHIHTARTIDAVWRTYRDIIHQSPNLMIVLQIRMHINMSAKRCRYRFLGYLQLIHICMAHIGYQSSLQLLGTSQGTYRNHTIQQFVLAIQLGVNLAIGHLCICQYMMEVMLAIMQLAYLRLCHQSGSWREEIGAHTSGLHISGKGMDFLFWQEMLRLDIACMDSSLISQAIHVDAAILAGLGIDGGIHLHASPTLGKRQLGPIFRTVHLQIALDADTVRYADFLHHRRVEHGGNHT